MVDPSRRWRVAAAATLFVAVVAEALHYTRGHYKTNRLIFIALALLGYALARPEPEPEDRRGRHLALLALLGTGLMVRDPRLLYASAEAQDSLRYLAAVAACASAGLLVLSFRPASPPGRRAALGVLALSALVAMRPVVLWGSPAPHIDVFTTLDRATDVLLSGANPYAAAYEDIYAGRYDYAPGVSYWPGAVVFAAVGKAAFGDLRGALGAAELAVAGFTAVLAGRRIAAVAAVAVLAFPVGPFVLEQAWVDPLVLAWLLGGLVLLDRGRFGWAGACVGVAVAVKQPAAIGALLVMAGVAARGRQAAFRFAAGAAATFAALVLPFVLWDPEGLYRMTLEVPLSQSLRTDALSLVALLAREYDLRWPGWGSAVVYAVTLAAIGARLWRSGKDEMRAAELLWPLALLYGVVFLFGKQAFANYWAFAALLALAGLAAASPAASRGTRSGLVQRASG